MSRLIERIKDVLHGTSHEQSHDHESGAAHGHADEMAQAAPETVEHEHLAEPEHIKEAHKHC